jgi:hypothetical protein
VNTKARPDWQQYFSEPEAPEHYGEAAARKYINERISKQEQTAGRLPFSAYIDELVVLNQDGEMQLHVKNSNGVTDAASCALFEFIGADGERITYPFATTTPTSIPLRWFGFDILDVMHMAAVEVLQTNGRYEPDARTKVPIQAWYYRPFTAAMFADPYEVIVPSSLRKQFDLLALCQFLGIVIPLNWAQEPHTKAELARKLAMRGQFWSLPVDKV